MNVKARLERVEQLYHGRRNAANEAVVLARRRRIRESVNEYILALGGEPLPMDGLHGRPPTPEETARSIQEYVDAAGE